MFHLQAHYYIRQHSIYFYITWYHFIEELNFHVIVCHCITISLVSYANHFISFMVMPFTFIRFVDTSRRVTSFHKMYDILFHLMLLKVILFFNLVMKFIIPLYFKSSQVMSVCVIRCHCILIHGISYHCISFYVHSCHFMSFNIQTYFNFNSCYSI